MIKIRLHYISAFILLFSWFTSKGQTLNIDSLQKSILESVQKKLNKKSMPGLNFDSIPFLGSKSQAELNETFKNLDKTLALAKSAGDVKKLQSGYFTLSAIDSVRGNYKGAYEHYKLYTIYRDSLQKKETEKRELQAKLQYEFDKKEAIAKAEQAKKDVEQKRIKNLQYFTIAGLVILVLVILLIAFIQWKNNRQRKKVNIVLQQQNQKVESALTELQSAQAQLIQSEKMASLGELTAGIAHEIQNPLNFVNNFSEVNKELIQELKNEKIKAKNERDEQLEIGILSDIEANEEKINHHGRRADAIVKGMLQHSGQSKGVKEAVNINELADEYLSLSYHGIRVKDKSFSATIKTSFDESIVLINIVPQDISRVLLNLYNNAFYTMNEKKKSSHLIAEGEDGNAQNKYEPTIQVSTSLSDLPAGSAVVLLTVKDNGNGIPQNIVDKIFQPFFTTKPTGQGTGLGLSLSYDIIKAHGGEIKVKTREGEGSEFIIQLPVS